MGRQEQFKDVATSQIITATTAVTTTAVSPFLLSNPFPIGDIVYNDLHLRFTNSLNLLTGGGAIVTDGGLAFIRALYFSTPQHGMIVDNVDGIMLHDMQAYRERAQPQHTDIASTAPGAAGNSEYYLKIPFKDPRSFSFNDTGLDTLRSGLPTLQINTGVYTDFVSGGDAADTIDDCTMESTLRLDPGPVTDPDIPTQFMPYFSVLRYPVSSTVAAQQIMLAFGDRIYKRIFIAQRNAAAPYARLANTCIGVNSTDRVSLKINSNFAWVDRLTWGALQQINAQDAQISAMPVGMAVFDFFRHISGGVDASNPKGGGAGAKLSDALSVLSQNQGTLELDADVTASGTTNQLWIGYDAVKILPLGARRPAAQPANSAK